MAPLHCVILFLIVGHVACVRADTYKFTPRRNIPSNDLACGQKGPNSNPVSYCRICGGIGAVADACDANPECKGFDMEGGYCGYLKAAAGPSVYKYAEGFSSFCREGSGRDCPGEYTMTRRTDIPGADIDCNYKDYKGNKQSYCQVMGTPTDVAAACSANPDCKAFTIVGSNNGYLKSTNGPTKYMEGTAVFTRG